MSTQEIFKNSKEVNKHSDDWKKVYHDVHKVLQSDNVRCLRNGNSLFIYHIESPGVASVFFVNADPIKAFIRNTEEALKAIKAAGFKKIYGKTDDMPTIKALQSLATKYGHQINIEETGLDASKNQTYKVTLDV